MKKILLGIFAFIALLSFTKQEAKAQWSLGPVLGYGFEAEYPYLGARLWYDVNKQWRIAPEFTYYLEGNEFFGFWAFDANAHYLIIQSPTGLFYALGGFQLAGVTISNGFTSETETELGINLGVGGETPVSPTASLFGEMKITIAGFDQVALAVGARFAL